MPVTRGIVFRLFFLIESTCARLPLVALDLVLANLDVLAGELGGELALRDDLAESFSIRMASGDCPLAMFNVLDRLHSKLKLDSRSGSGML